MQSIVLQQSRGLRPAAWPALLIALAPLVAMVYAAWLLQQYVPEHLDKYRIRILMDTGIAVIMAVSLNIVNGFTGQFSIGHGGFFAVGGYVAAAITYYCSLAWWGDATTVGGPFGAGAWLFLAATLGGGVVAAGAGYLVGLPSLRLRGDYLAIVTLGFGEIVRVLLEKTNSQLFDVEDWKEAGWHELIPPPLGGAQGFASIPKYTSLFWIYAFVAATLLFSYRLKQSSSGRALLSIREDEVAAQAMGVNITQLKVRAFVFAAFFAGLAGALFAHQAGTILRPVEAGFMRSFDAVIMVVLGGMGSISGAALAAILLTVIGEWLRDPTHIWFIGIYAGLARVALTPRADWRDVGVLAGAVAAVEALRASLGPIVAFPLFNIDVQLYELIYAGLLVVFCVLRGDLVRGVVFLVGLAIACEILRDLGKRANINLGDYRMVVYALLLILMMIFRPQGLFGVSEIWDYLPHRRHAAKAAR